MFTEEMAREIGIAYTIYCLICQEQGNEPIAIESFMKQSFDNIQKIRIFKGLVDENDVCG